MAEKLRVGVLFGGQSGEHEVSLTSARAVMDALDREKYEVVPIGITKDGRWLAGGDPHLALRAAADPKLLADYMHVSAEERNVAEQQALLATDTQFSLMTSNLGLDVVFPVLHGPKGEDGTIQGLLELAGIPYVGCGVLASAVGMDKSMMKAAFATAGLPQVPWLLVRRIDWQQQPEQTIAYIEQHLQYPMFVKPANLGSSVGISKAKTTADLHEALVLAASYDRRIVIEQGIDAREIEISVLGNEVIEASVPGEIIPSKEWYDYEAKYLDGLSKIVIPAEIAPEIVEQVKSMAIRAFAAVDGSGLARVDFLMERTSNQLFINEVNTMPGFTSASMYAKMWLASGMTYPELLDRLIALALERHQS
jgi:D-alanine-D-alanine ligase